MSERMPCQLVTGGSGFIGSCYVLQARRQGVRVVNLDKLTYAGNPANLAALKDDPDYVFVRGDIGNAELIAWLLETFQPQAVAFEELFFYRNVTTALQVGAGRGVALLAAQQAGLPLYEYTPMQIKQAVCGNGHADKRQIQQMVKLLLGLRELPKPDDAADALGVAICHANTMGPMAETFRIH